MKNYYFTFGKLKTHPFYGGWIIVKARNLRNAKEIFKMYFPNKENPMLCNCAIVYTEKDFKDTRMYISGNFGKRLLHHYYNIIMTKNQGENNEY